MEAKIWSVVKRYYRHNPSNTASLSIFAGLLRSGGVTNNGARKLSKVIQGLDWIECTFSSPTSVSIFVSTLESIADLSNGADLSFSNDVQDGSILHGHKIINLAKVGVDESMYSNEPLSSFVEAELLYMFGYPVVGLYILYLPIQAIIGILDTSQDACGTAFVSRVLNSRTSISAHASLSSSISEVFQTEINVVPISYDEVAVRRHLADEMQDQIDFIGRRDILNRGEYRARVTHREIIRYVCAFAITAADLIMSNHANVRGTDVASSGTRVSDRDDRVMAPTSNRSCNVTINCDVDSLMAMLPVDHEFVEYAREIIPIASDIIMDVGKVIMFKTPTGLSKGTHVTTADDLERCLREHEVDVGSNRAIFGDTRHRMSKVFYGKNVVGLTIRIAREIRGLAPLFEDFIMDRNVLVCGKPGSGKTTLLREICSYVSENKLLSLVDTNGEVCGRDTSSDETHGQDPLRADTLNLSRTFRPVKQEDQYGTLLDCVRNHSPDVIVIDEIHTKRDMDLCNTICRRSVNVIASVHGDIEDVVLNPEINKAIGGLSVSTLSDKNAKLITTPQTSSVRKTKMEMTNPPVFDVMIDVVKDDVGFRYVVLSDLRNTMVRLLDGESVSAISRRIDGGKVVQDTVMVSI